MTSSNVNTRVSDVANRVGLKLPFDANIPVVFTTVIAMLFVPLYQAKAAMPNVGNPASVEQSTPMPAPASITTTVSIPASQAASIGLASIGLYQVLSDAQWKDYEDAVELAVLNGIKKAAANAGQQLMSAEYDRIAALLRTQLDASTPSSARLQLLDVAGRLRYAVDTVSSLASSAQVGPFLPKVLFGLEKAKFNQLETPLDPGLQTPADMALYAVMTNAIQFVADQVQQSSELAQNDPQFAEAADKLLHELTTLISSDSYAQMQSAYASAVPNLPTPNSDGSYTINEQELISQFQTAVAGAQAVSR